MTRNRIFNDFFRQDADKTAILSRSLRTAGRRIKAADPLLEIRWEKVRTLRIALTTGRYDLDARLNDLLDNPPEELTLLAAG